MKQRQALAIDSIVREMVAPAAIVKDLEMLQEGEESVCDDQVVLLILRRFDELVISTKPKSVDSAAIGRAQSMLQAGLLELPGVKVPPDVDVKIVLSGSELSGYFQAVATIGDNSIPLEQGLRFEPNIYGLLTAFFLEVFLPTRWAWDHGLYDRDHKLVRTEAHLRRFLGTTDFPRQLKSREPWPSPRIRIRKSHDRYEVSSLAASPTRGLLDLSMAVIDGKASMLSVRNLYVSGYRTFY